MIVAIVEERFEFIEEYVKLNFTFMAIEDIGNIPLEMIGGSAGREFF